MIKIKLQYEWQPQPGRGVVVNAALFDVLYAVHETGLLAAAARRVGMSYRHVWGLMGKWERIFGRPLVALRKGRGASLTEFGRKLLWAEQLVQARLVPELESVRHAIGKVLADTAEPSVPALPICASHDLALAELRDRLLHRKGLQLDLRFEGSIASLSALAKGECILAGFHIAEGMERSAAAPFRRLLKASEHVLIGFATRTQGLMLARGNPKSIESLADLTRPGVRIVNRQRGSGSRVEFDQLIAGAGIEAGAIEGYEHEEFTHLAVAATVAGGMADAGYGIRAAAVQYGLHYIPLLTERYFLACGRSALESQQVSEFVDILRSDELRKILAGLPGYGTAITGAIHDVKDILRPAPARAQPRSNAVCSSSRKLLVKRATGL